MSLALVRALVHFLWQGALVWALTALLLRAFRSPAIRYWVACVALLACLVLPLASFLGDLGTAPPCTPVRPVPDRAALEPVRITPPPEPWHARLEAPLHLDRTLLIGAPYVLLAWGTGSLLLVGRALLGFGWVGRARRASTPLVDARWLNVLEGLRQRSGLGRRVWLRVLANGESPFTFGTFRPFILVPASVLTGFPPALVEALLAHELAHVIRFDSLVNLLQGAVEILLFYHPAVWWISRRIRQERELACDDLALRILGDPQEKSRDLALALHELDRLQLSIRAAVPAATGGNLMQRIRRLLHPEPRPHTARILLTTLAFGGLCLVADYAAQQRAQAAPPKAPVLPVLPAVPAKGGRVFSFSSLQDRDPALSYALARKDQSDMVYVGSSRRIGEVEPLRGTDALWFREKGRSYVIQDATLLAEATAAYRSVEEASKRLGALGQQMGEASKGIEAVSREMSAISRQQMDVSRRMEATSREAYKIQQAMFKVERRRDRAKLADLPAVDADLVVLEAKLKEAEKPMKALDAEMEKLEGPMKALEARMVEAEKPMKDLEARMKPVEAEVEQAHVAFEKALESLIRKAQTTGLAKPLDAGKR